MADPACAAAVHRLSPSPDRPTPPFAAKGRSPGQRHRRAWSVHPPPQMAAGGLLWRLKFPTDYVGCPDIRRLGELIGQSPRVYRPAALMNMAENTYVSPAGGPKLSAIRTR
jgi:hypothetical protein